MNWTGIGTSLARGSRRSTRLDRRTGVDRVHLEHRNLYILARLRKKLKQTKNK